MINKLQQSNLWPSFINWYSSNRIKLDLPYIEAFLDLPYIEAFLRYAKILQYDVLIKFIEEYTTFKLEVTYLCDREEEYTKYNLCDSNGVARGDFFNSYNELIVAVFETYEKK